MNLYRYCGNDPVNACDPSGLWFVWGISVGVQANAIGAVSGQTGIYAKAEGYDPLAWQLSLVNTVTVPETPGGVNTGVSSSMPSASYTLTASILPHATDASQLAGISHGVSASASAGEGEVVGGSLGYSNVPNGPLGSTDDSNYSLDGQVSAGFAMKSPISAGLSSTNTSTTVQPIGSVYDIIGNAVDAIGNFGTMLRNSIDNFSLWSLVGGRTPPTNSPDAMANGSYYSQGISPSAADFLPNEPSLFSGDDGVDSNAAGMEMFTTSGGGAITRQGGWFHPVPQE